MQPVTPNNFFDQIAKDTKTGIYSRASLLTQCLCCLWRKTVMRVVEGLAGWSMTGSVDQKNFRFCWKLTEKPMYTARLR